MNDALQPYPAGVWSEVFVDFYLHRDCTWYCVFVMLPVGLVALLAAIGFLPIEMLPRIVIGIACPLLIAFFALIGIKRAPEV